MSCSSRTMPWTPSSSLGSSSTTGSNIDSRVVATELTFRQAIARVRSADRSLRLFAAAASTACRRCESPREMAPATPFIFVSGTIGEERAIEALKRGAVDYVLKDNLRRLVPAIRSALRQSEATRAQGPRRGDAAPQRVAPAGHHQYARATGSGSATAKAASRSRAPACSRSWAITITSCSAGARRTTSIRPTSCRCRRRSPSSPSARATIEGPHAALAAQGTARRAGSSARWSRCATRAARSRGVRGIDRDVTVRMAQEVRIRRLNRALRFLSGASSAVDALARPRAADQGGVPPRGQRRRLRARDDLSAAGRRQRHASRSSARYGGAEAAGTKWSMGGTLPEGVTPVTQALATGQARHR